MKLVNKLFASGESFHFKIYTKIIIGFRGGKGGVTHAGNTFSFIVS